MHTHMITYVKTIYIYPGSREVLVIEKHTEGVIVEPHSTIVLVNFDDFPGIIFS